MLKDLTGQKFGKLTVIKYAYSKNNNRYWECQCECGNITYVATRCLNSGTKSCGCLSAPNLTGQRFGKLTVIRSAGSKSQRQLWECKCDCGKTVFLNTKDLRTNKTKSCGCLVSTDLTGKRFGKLIVIKQNGVNHQGRKIWECKCDCGATAYVATNHLTGGETQSCGCIKSKGEAKINKILSDNKIPFETQKIFDSCIGEKGHPYKYDFYVNNNYLIEYDGDVHFITRNNGWNNQENLERVQKNDKIKNEWAKNNNIPLIRIPYTHFDKICLEDLLLETTTFLI